MKIRWKERFKEDYKELEKRLKKPIPFRKALFRAVSILEKGDDLSEKYTVNRIPAQGPGWYDCYVFEDIIMIYKIQGRYVKLSRLGTPKKLQKER
ncbi:MAG: type II toxin-antitoxin system mRNA interferase toxin, RelE/StbE family [Planctomycetes bacterium]|nr:type II toxin-antitoxin system mRNA interferase toxin, RelE/StbE family [Planctomycetota bacterium]